MRWSPPWARGHLGAIEMKALPDLIVTVRGLDRNNDVEPVVLNLRTLFQKTNIPFREATDEYVDRDRGISAGDVKLYNYPPGSAGMMFFGRVFVLPNPRYEVVERLFNFFSVQRRLNRIELRTTFSGTKGGAQKMTEVRYILGYPDGKPRFVSVINKNGEPISWSRRGEPGAQVNLIPVERDRFNDALRHLMGIYMVS